MELRITQEFFKKVVPEWYDSELLSGKGTLEEQICEYEAELASNEKHYTRDLKLGAARVEVVKEDKRLDFCTHCFSKTCGGECEQTPKEMPRLYLDAGEPEYIQITDGGVPYDDRI